MTYDIHGQWDAGNLWASPGCPTGNCLRSHVNLTETVNALIMITKADVPANKVLVGVTSYGRSFQMADPSCTGPTCLFTGDRATSNARKGRCTKEAGYMSNAEIFEQTGHTSLESTSNSNIWIDKDLWVSYMDDNLKTSRTAFYKKFNFGGTSDWALDLLKYRNPPSYDFGDQDLGISWKEIKVNLKAGRQATCDRTARSGNWININCGKSEALGFTQFTPEERWKALECSYAWKDLKRRWLGCRDGEDEGVFGLVASEFLHGPQDTVSRSTPFSAQWHFTKLGNRNAAIIHLRTLVPVRFSVMCGTRTYLQTTHHCYLQSITRELAPSWFGTLSWPSIM